ncbi:MAG: hypothetical protein H7Z74_17435 [Anaerolineae bacterium]|nr:hypothetical protein [Gemmatimonadaceae bacterium]
MRRIVLALLLAPLVVACEEGGTQAIFGTVNSGVATGSVRISVVDDPLGAAVVSTAGSRPTVTLIFSADLVGASTISVTNSNQTAIQVAVDSVSPTVVTIANDTVRAGTFSTVRLRLISATLAIPGAAQTIDLLGGTIDPVITRTVSITVGANTITSIVVDINSGSWLRPVTNPLPGQPAYTFDGTTAFLAALSIRAQ